MIITNKDPSSNLKRIGETNMEAVIRYGEKHHRSRRMEKIGGEDEGRGMS